MIMTTEGIGKIWVGVIVDVLPISKKSEHSSRESGISWNNGN